MAAGRCSRCERALGDAIDSADHACPHVGTSSRIGIRHEVELPIVKSERPAVAVVSEWQGAPE